MFTAQFFKWCAIITYFLVTVSGRNVLKIKLDRVDGMCRRNKDTKVLYKDYSYKMSNETNNIQLNYTIIVKEDVSDLLNVRES